MRLQSPREYRLLGARVVNSVWVIELMTSERMNMALAAWKEGAALGTPCHAEGWSSEDVMTKQAPSKETAPFLRTVEHMLWQATLTKKDSIRCLSV